MKYFVGLFIIFFVANLSATNLCDSSCILSITFPDGGSIKVDEDTTITFGSGAYINNGSSTISFPAGDKLEIDDDESLKFKDGGTIDIGRYGNIDYEELKVTSDGEFNLAAGERGLIIINEIKLNGDIKLNISSDFKVLKGGKFHVKDGIVTAIPDLMFINLGDVKGHFQFSDSTIHYLKNKNSYKKDSKINELIKELTEGRENIKEIDKSEVISGEVFLDTKKSFILIPSNSDIPDESDTTVNPVIPDDQPGIVININQGGTTGSIDSAGVSDNPVQSDSPGPLDSSISIESTGAGAINLLMLFIMIFIKLTSGMISGIIVKYKQD